MAISLQSSTKQSQCYHSTNARMKNLISQAMDLCRKMGYKSFSSLHKATGISRAMMIILAKHSDHIVLEENCTYEEVKRVSGLLTSALSAPQGSENKLEAPIISDEQFNAWEQCTRFGHSWGCINDHAINLRVDPTSLALTQIRHLVHEKWYINLSQLQEVKRFFINASTIVLPCKKQILPEQTPLE